jgi:hypothetical protein
MPDDPQISYSVKEVLDRIERKMDGFVNALGAKADMAALSRAFERIDTLEEDLRLLKAELDSANRHVQWKQEFRRFVAPFLVSVATLLVFFFQVFHL